MDPLASLDEAITARSQGSLCPLAGVGEALDSTHAVQGLLHACCAETLSKTKLLIGKTFCDVIGTSDSNIRTSASFSVEFLSLVTQQWLPPAPSSFHTDKEFDLEDACY